MTATADFLSFWGKAQPGPAAVHSWHPIAHHLLDVAAVAESILVLRPVARTRAGALLGLSPDDACRLLVALIALHDVGKFAPAFQAKRSDLWPGALAVLEPTRMAPTHHTADGYALWDGLLSARLADQLWRGGRRTLDVLAPSIFGHHGRPVRSRDAARPVASVFGAAAERAALACADAVVALLLPEPITAPAPSEAAAHAASWWVAGLTTVADWVGSNQACFPYAAPTGNLADYWTCARRLASEAVGVAGLVAPRPARRTTFATLTGIATPSPAQKWAATAALADGPLLVILEDVTGAGKTEAAQMLVHRLMTDGRVAGAYWAMPTQATANAMYARQARAVGGLFDARPAGPRPSVALAHGQAALHQGFRATVLGDPADPPKVAGPDDAGLPAEAACAAFLADDRRRALLADVGAGTVDQALLGTLPSRFNCVRLFGMADKVLVFDEAHAYDAYMGVEAQQLLRFQAALGGSAILLSATLSRKQREAFAAAWMEGLDGGNRRVARLGAGGPAPLLRSEAYPLATVVAGGAGPAAEWPVEAAPWSRRSVAVRSVRDESEALRHVIACASNGAAVAWVRNTVHDCLAAAAAVRATGIEPIVFHARFAQVDRQAIEERVVALFGKGSSAAERRGAVLVATQVVEQSLDLDFDALVTDLAPIDLLVQRAGRLQRHEARDAARPAGIARELVVLAPSTDAEPAADWLTAVLPKTRYVYRNLGVLWRTAKVLDAAGAIETPGGLRALIEAVYGSDDVPAALQQVTEGAEGEDLSSAATAMQTTLPVAGGYHGDQQGWVDDVKPLTRLGDEQTSVRLARLGKDRVLAPWAARAEPTWRAWALSEVRLSASRVPFGSTAAPEYGAAIDAARLDWGRFEQGITVLPLVERTGEPGVWDGTLHLPHGARVVALSYSPTRGVQYEPASR